MRILVTGGSGFIGSNLVAALLKTSHEVCIVTRSIGEKLSDDGKASLIIGDLDEARVHSAVAEFQPDLVYHLAWHGIPDYGISNCLLNMSINLRFIAFLGEIGVRRIVITGSCWEYGRTTGELSETLTPIPSNLFTATKMSILQMAEQMANDFSFELIWARLFYVYGPGQNPHSLLPILFKTAQGGTRPVARSPHAKNDFVFVQDVVSSLMAMGENRFQPGTYNVGSGYATQVGEITEMIAEMYGYTKTSEPKVVTSDSDPNFWADISLLRGQIDFEPTPIMEGLLATREWFEIAQKDRR